MPKLQRHHWLQLAVGLTWLVVLLVGLAWFHHLGIPFRRVPRELRLFLRLSGLWGPVIILGLYLLRSVFFLAPSTLLTLVTGSLYGPIWGTLLNLLGENITVNVSFALGRLVGRSFVKESEKGWVKKYDDLLRQEGFMSIIFMRVLYFPFDVVNYGAGISGMTYSQYFWGSLIGLIPGVVTLTVLGDAFTNPRAFIAFAGLFVCVLGLALLLRRSAWMKRRLYPPHVHEHVS